MGIFLDFMNDMKFMLEHFFTHKDFLPDASLIPGTLFTPLQIFFEIIILIFIIAFARYVAKRKELIKPIFKTMFFALVIFEVMIISWDTMASADQTFDFAINLPLYPCSIFMFVLPFIIWGKGISKQIACGYVCTLGLIGALINFLYPIARLMDYSCISFPAFHTFFYHGSMLFACLVLLMSKTHCYKKVSTWWNPFLASIPGLLVSIPANIINYSPIHADYMYFTNQHFLSQMVFGNTETIKVTLVMYLVYLIVPACFYLPFMATHVIKTKNFALKRLIQSLISNI